MTNKRYLIVCPTALEAKHLLNKAARSNQRLDIFSLEEFDADILITGIGIHKTTYSLTKVLCKNKYDFVIHIGIAGSFDKNLPLTSLAVINSEVFGDLGIESKKGFSTLFDLELAQKNDLPFTNGRLINKNNVPDYFSQFTELQGITINSLLQDEKKNSLRADKFHTQIESMEGAAVFFVCLFEKMEFIEIRAISNYVGERDKGKWKIEESVKNLNSAILDFLMI